MAETGGTLRVNAERRATDNGEKVCLYFEDNGPGVEERFKDRVFDPFFTTKDPGKGTGMGLAVSQSIVRDHDGEISLEPERAGRGSWSRWPPRMRPPLNWPRAPESMENERCTILVVDDDREMSSILVEILSAADYRALSASSGADDQTERRYARRLFQDGLDARQASQPPV